MKSICYPMYETTGLMMSSQPLVVAKSGTKVEQLQTIGKTKERPLASGTTLAMPPMGMLVMIFTLAPTALATLAVPMVTLPMVQILPAIGKVMTSYLIEPVLMPTLVVDRRGTRLANVLMLLQGQETMEPASTVANKGKQNQFCCNGFL